MKYNKALPLYYRVWTPKGNIVKATMMGIMQVMYEQNMTGGQVESVQKVNGEWEVVTGKARGIINEIVDRY